MKKFLLISLILVFSLAMFAGCSTEEAGFYQLTKEVSALQAYAEEGTMTFTMDKDAIATVGAGSTDEETQAVLAALAKFDITYSAAYDAKTSQGYFDWQVAFSGKTYDMGRMVIDKNYLYLEAAPLLAIAEPYFSDEEKAYVRTFIGDAKWLAFDLAATYGSTYVQMPDDIMSWAVDYSNACMGSVEEVIYNVAKDYSPGLVKRSGKGYELYLDDQNVIPVGVSLAQFAINKAEPLGQVIKDLCNKEAFKEYLAMMDITEADIAYLEASIDEVVADIQANSDIYLAVVKDFETDQDVKDAVAMFDGSKLSIYAEKSGSYYKEDMDMLLKIQDLGTFSLSTNNKISKKTSITMTVPAAEQSVDVMQRAEELSQETVAFVHTADADVYVYRQYLDLGGELEMAENDGVADIKLIDDRAYLPLRLTGELLGADVDWDQSTGVASITTTKGSFTVQGQSFNDRIYIPIRQFEQYGYTINYDTNVGHAAYDAYSYQSYWYSEQQPLYIITVTAP